MHTSNDIALHVDGSRHVIKNVSLITNLLRMTESKTQANSILLILPNGIPTT